MPLIVGRECSLGARCVLVGSVLRTPAPLRRANVARGPPLPAPPRAPPPSAPRWGRAVSRLWRGFFVRGPALPRSPRAPLPLYVSVCGCVCPYVCGCGYQAFLFCRGSVGGGFRGPSVVLRPPRFGADAGCRPMCPASRLRPPLACALGRCAPRLPVLGSLRSLRFKRACGGRSVPFRLAIARFRPTHDETQTRFCHVGLTKHYFSG